MKLLSLLHRWAGGLIGLLLALLGLTGTILVWEPYWVTLQGASDPVVEDASAIGRIVEQAAQRGDLSRVTFASDEIGLHQIVYADGGGAYARQDGFIADRWASQWERPELWLFDLHHHLFAGHAGETVTGIAGIAGLLFVVTGAILWWRSRRSFAPRLLPQRLAPGPIVKHHRDLGIIVAPLLLLSLTTGVLMIFQSIDHALLGKPDAGERPRIDSGTLDPSAIGRSLRIAKSRFPDAHLRRISLPAGPGQPIVVRMRQSFEWTPNGRTQLSFDPRTGALLDSQDPALAARGASIREKFYPLHSAKAGGVAMTLLMTISGLSLTILGGLATYSFWARRPLKRLRRRYSGEPLVPGAKIAISAQSNK